MGQGGLAQTRRAIKEQMVQRLTPAFGRGNGYVQIFLDRALADEVFKMPRPQAGIERYVLSAGFT